MTSSRVFADSNLDPRFRAGIVGHWIGGGSGLTWFDRSGRGNHASLVGPSWTLGDGGQRSALEFDGTDDRADIAGLTTSTTYTLSARFKPKSQILNYGGIVASPGGAQSIYYRGSDAAASAGKITIWDLGAAFTSSGVLTDGAWNHLAFVVSAGSLAFYLNGRLDGTGVAPSIAIIRLGFDDFAWYLRGVLDDLRVYNRALSAAEIATLADPAYSPIIGGGLICGL